MMENKEIKIFLVEDPLRESYASNIVVIETSDIEAEFSKANDSGAIFRSPIEEGAFGGKEFAIKDYEDNTIIFRQNA
ncbi:MAG: hypothetical protein GY934_06785 [Gammaproteobacteria bacterium]|nr:hypothetical protein [Gammaproteobacteria bacterium]